MNLEDGLEASTLIGTTATNVKGDETEILKKTLKVGNFFNKTAKPKFSKIRQKSNFAPILLGCISKFLEEQGLSEKQGQISVATIFKLARFKSGPDLKKIYHHFIKPDLN